MTDTKSPSETQAPSEMVERVARAIAVVWGHRASSSWGRYNQQLFRDGAAAAISAMREPTEKLITAGRGGGGK